jgi:hypothetical protein
MIERAETACPQCGALLTMPHQVDTFACSHCGSSLRAGGALRLHRLVEHPSVDRRDAEGCFRSWTVGDDVPADLGRSLRYEVGDLRYFPFLRARRTGTDHVAPLAPLPTPEVMSLARVPARLQAEEEASSEGPRSPDRSDVEGEAVWAGIDGALLREQLRKAGDDPEVTGLLIEQRCYYPVRYTYRGAQYSAVVGAGAGTVLVDHRPARPDVPVERRVAAGALVLLFAEALVLPSLALRIAAIGATAVGLYPVLRRYVERHG